MIVLKSGEVGLVILEPGNLRKLQQGDPLVLDMAKYGLMVGITVCYAPDIEWMELQIKNNMPVSPEKLADILQEGIQMKPVDRAAKPV